MDSSTSYEIKYTENDVLDATFNADGELIYTKMADNDSKIGSLMLMVKSRKLRHRKESVLLEGKRLIRDALSSGCKLQHLMFSRIKDVEFIKDLLPQNDVKIYKMAYRDIQMWSDLTTSPGIMGIFAVPNLADIIPEITIPLTIICDNIREPGNLGAILRTSVAVGCQKILMTKGCVDIWEPKVLRGSSGAHFKLPIYNNIEWENMGAHVNENSTIFLADNLVLSSDTKISDAHLDNIRTTLPVVPYYGVNFRDFTSVVLVIGGETLGLSDQSYQLAKEKNGLRLNVPLENNVESLNTGTALGILAFEIKRQLAVSKEK